MYISDPYTNYYDLLCSEGSHVVVPVLIAVYFLILGSNS
jgi:hypothetical protein